MNKSYVFVYIYIPLIRWNCTPNFSHIFLTMAQDRLREEVSERVANYEAQPPHRYSSLSTITVLPGYTWTTHHLDKEMRDVNASYIITIMVNMIDILGYNQQYIYIYINDNGKYDRYIVCNGCVQRRVCYPKSVQFFSGTMTKILA